MSNLPASQTAAASLGPSSGAGTTGTPPSRAGFGVAGSSSGKRGGPVIQLESAPSPLAPTGATGAINVAYDSNARSASLRGGVAGFVLVVVAALLATWPAAQVAGWWRDVVDLLGTAGALSAGGSSGGADGAGSSLLEASYASEVFRWVLVALLALTGAALGRVRPGVWLVMAALVAGAGYCVNALLAEQPAEALAGLSAAEGFVMRSGVVAAVALSYLIQSGARTKTLTAGGVLGFVLVALASLAVVRNWYHPETVAGWIGPAAVDFVRQWGEECTWAVVLILTAVGIVSGRTRAIHFLNAVVLIALAFHCAKAGYAEMRTFPELSADPAMPIAIEEVSVRNVEPWRWMITLELGCLAAVLLHMALGIGVLNLAYAVALMTAGLALSHSVGTMSLVRAGSDAFGRSAEANPLFNMGLPVNGSSAAARPGAPPAARPGAPALARPAAPGAIDNEVNPGSGAIGGEPRTGAASTDPTLTSPALTETTMRDTPATGAASTGAAPPALSQVQLQAQRATEVRLSREAAVREITPFVWIFLTAVVAGVAAATGLRMLIPGARHRAGLAMLLVFAFGVGVTLLWSVWPRNPHQSWSAWLAAFKLSRYHAHTVWLVFLGVTALAGGFALHAGSRVVTWIHATVALVLVGTMASMVAAAVLIQFGNFPQLPVWVYAVVAAGQSSLAWILLMHLNFSARSPQRRAVFSD